LPDPGAPGNGVPDIYIDVVPAAWGGPENQGVWLDMDGAGVMSFFNLRSHGGIFRPGA
jgi:hypothetical protein